MECGIGLLHFPDDLKDKHIFRKEMYAAVQGVLFHQSLYKATDLVDVITDKTAVAAVLGRLYSSKARQRDVERHQRARMGVHCIGVSGVYSY